MSRLIIAVSIVVVLGLGAVIGYSRLASAVTPPPYTAYQADINHDGKVNVGDQAILASKVGQSAPLPTATLTSYCNLNGRDLSDTNGPRQGFFANANRALKGKCSFVGTNFTSAYIGYADFADADFTGALWTGAHTYHSNFVDAILVGVQAQGLDSPGASFYGANLAGADLSGSNTYCADYATQECGPGGLNFTNFDAANLTGANLSNVSAYMAHFANANLTNATLSSGQTGPVNSSRAFYGATFVDAITTGANVAGVIWNNTTCPDGTNSDNNGGSCVGHGFAGTPLATWTPTATATAADTPTSTATPVP